MSVYDQTIIKLFEVFFGDGNLCTACACTLGQMSVRTGYCAHRGTFSYPPPVRALATYASLGRGHLFVSQSSPATTYSPTSEQHSGDGSLTLEHFLMLLSRPCRSFAARAGMISSSYETTGGESATTRPSPRDAMITAKRQLAPAGKLSL